MRSVLHLVAMLLGISVLPTFAAEAPMHLEDPDASRMDVSGIYVDAWQSHRLVLFQDGTTVTGVWGEPGQAYHGNIKGTLNGRILSGILQCEGRGNPFKMALTFPPEGGFSGRIENMNHGWTASRQPGVVLEVTPATLQIVKPGDQIAYSARVAGTADKTVTWSATVGSISEDGHFTVPVGCVGSVQTITATAHADPTQETSVQLSITEKGVLEVSGAYVDSWMSQRLVLFQDGPIVTGVWGQPGQVYYGTIHGNLKGQALTGTLQCEGYKKPFPLLLTFAPDGESFNGRIETLNHDWSAARQAELVIQVEPSTLQIVKPGDRIDYRARVAGARDKSVTWSATAGTFDGTGCYTVPEDCVGSVQTLTARANADPLQQASVQVSITANGILDISGIYVDGWLSQKLTLFQAGVAVSGTWGQPGQSYHGRITGTLSGQALSGALYCQDRHLPIPLSVVFSADGRSFKGRLETLNHGWSASRQPGLLIQVAPTFQSVRPLEKHLFQALVGGTLDKSVTWHLSPGQLTPDQVRPEDAFSSWIEAPETPGTYNLTAVANAAQGTSATATLQVVGPPRVTVAVLPGSVELPAGSKTSFRASVEGTRNPNVIWRCSAGSIDASGNFTAPEAPGSYAVMAALAEDPAKIAGATVVVTAASGQDRSFSYDRNGNLSDDGHQSYAWDAENRLVAVVNRATGHRSEFSYDGFGRRVGIRELDPDQAKNLQVTGDRKYLWDGTEIAEERTADGGTVVKRFFGQGFIDSDGTALFYTRDHLGSIRELTDGTQALRARYEYAPYGRMTKVGGDRESGFGYTGHFWHAQSSLNLTLFRAYDPGLGRWLSRDPLEAADQHNLYGYVGNDPVNAVDPLGLHHGPDCGGAAPNPAEAPEAQGGNDERSSQTNSGGPFYPIYLWDYTPHVGPIPTGTPHTFIETPNKTRGFYPESTWRTASAVITSPGQIKDDSGHRHNDSPTRTFLVDAATLSRVEKWMDWNPGFYELNNGFWNHAFNCTGWANRVLSNAGVESGWSGIGANPCTNQ